MGTGPGRRQCPQGRAHGLRLRHGRRHLRWHGHQSAMAGWRTPDQAARVRERVRPVGPVLLRRTPDTIRRERPRPQQAGRDQGGLRLRHVSVSGSMPDRRPSGSVTRTAELGQFLMGQTESPFMDLDVFPNSLDYWGPNGMVFFRNVQFRWTPIQGKNVLQFAVERPGRQRRPGILRRSRSSSPTSPRASPCPTSRPATSRAVTTGGTSSSPASCGTSSGTTSATSSSTSRATRWAGASTSARTSRPTRRATCYALQVIYGRGRRELHERRTGRHRDPEQLQRPAVSRSSGRPCRCWGSWRSTTAPGTKSGRVPSAGRWSTSTTPMA